MGLIQLQMARGGASQLQGDLLREDATQLGGHDGAVAISLALRSASVGRCLEVSRSTDRRAMGRVGTGAQPLQG